MSKYFKIVNGTTFDLNNIIPAGNRVLSNLYTGFPTTTNAAVDTANFDAPMGTTGYSIANGDLGLLFPGVGTFYEATFVRNQITCAWQAYDPDASLHRFHSPKSFNTTIESCYNHISIACQGGGGGGGGSSTSNNNGISGGGGGGGGWFGVKRADLNVIGRGFYIEIGAGGTCGLSENKYRTAGARNGGDGGRSLVQSNTNFNKDVIAYGGYGGRTYVHPGNDPFSGNGGPSGTGTSNLASGTSVYAHGSGNSAGQAGRQSADAYGPLGGDSRSINQIGGNFASIKSPNGEGNNQSQTNNQPGLPAGGYITGQTFQIGGNVQYNGPGQPIYYNIVGNAYGGGGGGAASNNVGNGRPGLTGGPGAPGYVVIYKYLS